MSLFTPIVINENRAIERVIGNLLFFFKRILGYLIYINTDLF